MDSDQKDICNFLKTTGTEFISSREISRRAGGKWRPRQDPSWASEPLNRLLEQGMVETDESGYFRLVRKQEIDPKQKKWVSPKMKQILQDSGKNFSHIIRETDL